MIQNQSVIKAKLQNERKELCRHNFREFCYNYLPENFYAQPSIFHEELFERLQEQILNGKADSEVDAAPRGNAKSTIISFALPLWCALYEHKHYIIVASDTADQANDFLTNIKNELEDNDLIVEDFGDQVGLIWTNSNIILQSGVRIQAFGAGKKIRGRRYRQYRPDLIIGDDLENDENVASAEQRKKMEAWYFKALSKAGDERTDKIVIGTIMHYDSLLSKLLQNPTYKAKKYQAVIEWSKSNKWAEWERIITNLENPNRLQDAEAYFLANKEEMTEGTRVLWPEKESYYDLMVQRVADGPSAFSSEKQNEPLSDEDRRFLPEWIQYYEDEDIKGKKLYIAGTCDPSMGKAGGDYSAIITGGMDSNSQVYILDADLQKRHPDIIISDVLAKHEYYQYKAFGVEENQFQEYFKDAMQRKIDEEKRGKGLIIKGIRSHSDKILRIQSLQPDIRNGRIKFKKSQQRLIDQLLNFPTAEHDDGPDALEILMSILGKKSGFEEYFESQANEATKSTINTLFANTTRQRLG